LGLRVTITSCNG